MCHYNSRLAKKYTYTNCRKLLNLRTYQSHQQNTIDVCKSCFFPNFTWFNIIKHYFDHVMILIRKITINDTYELSIIEFWKKAKPTNKIFYRVSNTKIIWGYMMLFRSRWKICSFFFYRQEDNTKVVHTSFRFIEKGVNKKPRFNKNTNSDQLRSGKRRLVITAKLQLLPYLRGIASSPIYLITALFRKYLLIVSWNLNKQDSIQRS